MEDYKVLQTGDDIQEILNQAPVDTADIAELKEAATSLDGRLEAVEGKIPSGASSENPLTDKQYVDSSIASASATFRGTYNEVTDLELTTDATHADIGSALDEVIELADSNDYCFVQIPTDDETPMEIDSIERYKFVTGTGWEYEYTLNNSGFTAGQWAAINSGITSGLVTKLTDLPTNAELENLLNGKANATDVYTKSETYNKTELDSMITTPDVQYVSVTATAQTTAVTDVLPSTGAADTVYRVGSWDGTQYNANSYSEYAWNGSSYVLLNVKETGIATGSDFDNPTPAQRELVTTVGSVLDGISEGVFDLTAKTGDSYATLADALTAANTAIPTNKKRGGMSIKFVQSSDNKYVQYRLMKNTWSTTVSDWQGVDDEPVAGSENLVKSGGVYSTFLKEVGGDIDLDSTEPQNLYILSGNTWTTITSYKGLLLPAINGKTYEIKGQSSASTFFAFVKSVGGSTDPVQYATGASRVVISAGGTETVVCPSDAKYLWTSYSYNSGTDNAPVYVKVKGIKEYVDGEVGELSLEAVKHTVQSLTNEQKTTARNNISAASIESVNDINNAVIDIAGLVINLNSISAQSAYIVSDGDTWRIGNSNYTGKAIQCVPGKKYIIKATANSGLSSVFAFVKSIGSQGDSIQYATGETKHILASGRTLEIVCPEDAVYLFVNYKYYANNIEPQSIQIEGIIVDIEKQIEKVDPYSGERTSILENVWEYGGLDASTGKMLKAKKEIDFFRTLRTKNYIRLKGFNYEPVQDSDLYVYKYDNEYNYLGRELVESDFDLPNDVVYVKLMLFVNDTSNAVSVILSQGGLDDLGLEEESQYFIRTDYIDMDNIPFDTMWLDGYATIYAYDENHQILESASSYAKASQGRGGICVLRSLIGVLNNMFPTLFDDAKYIRLKFRAEAGGTSITPSTFNIRFTSGDAADISRPNVYVGNYTQHKNIYENANTMSFAFQIHQVNGRCVTAAEAAQTPPPTLNDEGKYMSSVMMILPPNYKNDGDPVKLIMWCHGSGDYSALGDDLISNYYTEYLGYWQKEGFAVADVYARTSKYGSVGGDINGMPTNTIAYEQGYYWIKEHFNIDESGVYVSAKSMGGVGALNIIYSNIPVKAADILAPALNQYYQQLGYGISSRRDHITDLKLDYTGDLLTNGSAASPMSFNDFAALMVQNEFKAKGYNSYFSGIVNKTFEELVYLKFKNQGTFDDVVKLCKCPIRIHIAIDDTTVSYYQSLNLINMIKNSGCTAEIRTMPAGCASPHHAVDNDPDAQKVASITTELGYVCTNVPLAYVEACEWFKYYK